MKIGAISDLHGDLITNIEKCDLLLIAGDIIPLDIQGNFRLSEEWLKNDFKKWAKNLPCDKVLFIAGNHDLYAERHHKEMSIMFPLYEKVTYLLNEEYLYIGNDGKVAKIFGSPYCHIFGNWAFMVSDDTIAQKLEKLSEGTDILLTHDAPYGTSDVALEPVWWHGPEHIGCIPIRDAVLNKKPKYHIHGHLHSTDHNWEQLGETQVVNVSVKNEKYEVVYDPLYFEL